MRKRALFAACLTSLALSAGAVANHQGTPREGPDIVGTDASETLRGTVTPERIFALAGADVLYGDAGGDYLDGGRGSDTIYGDSGNDFLTGEVCNQERCDAPEADVMYGGVGADTIESNSCRDDVSPPECPAGSSNDRMYGDSGNDIISARAPGASTLSGGAGSDVLTGNTGAERFSGGSGRDRITAGRGNDRISVADSERDTVNCGIGRDTVTADRKDTLKGCETVRYRR